MQVDVLDDKIRVSIANIDSVLTRTAVDVPVVDYVRVRACSATLRDPVACSEPGITIDNDRCVALVDGGSPIYRDRIHNQ